MLRWKRLNNRARPQVSMKLIVIIVLMLAAVSFVVAAQGAVVFSEDGARQERQMAAYRQSQQSRSTDSLLRRELKVGNPANASDVAAALTRRYPKNVTPQKISYARQVGSNVRAKRVEQTPAECRTYTSPWLVRMCADAVKRNRWMTSVGNKNPQQNVTKSKTYSTISNVMKTKHDTAKNSISNVR